MRKPLSILPSGLSTSGLGLEFGDVQGLGFRSYCGLGCRRVGLREGVDLGIRVQGLGIP